MSTAPLANDPAKTQSLEDEDKSIYCSIFRSLLYVTLKAKPDTGTTASMLGIYVSTSQRKHLGTARPVLEYLRGTTNSLLKLSFRSSNQ